MQHTQFNFVCVFALTGLLVAADSAAAGPITRPVKSDPILDAGDTHPCLAGPDMASGMDVTGQPVVPAGDAGAAQVPLPDQILMPLGGESSRRGRSRGRASIAEPGNGSYVALDGGRLAPLLGPGPCHGEKGRP